MQRVLLGIIVLVAALLSVEGALAQERMGTVDTVKISGAIDPASERLFARALDRAITDQAEVLIVLLDTPGGLDSSMRAMVQGMLMSPVPIVVYVYPQGGRAGQRRCVLGHGGPRRGDGAGHRHRRRASGFRGWRPDHGRYE